MTQNFWKWDLGTYVGLFVLSSEMSLIHSRGWMLTYFQIYI